MKIVIPAAALIGLLLQTKLQAASYGNAGSPNPSSYDSALTTSNNFTCNEPFMIPAEYIDREGNSFAMCISDPKFLKSRIIWYIQGLNGSSYKALGVAKRHGSATFIGKVVPIEEPTTGSGMHADPVAVRVTLDRKAGVISVNPMNRGGRLVNWIIRPNGFPSGSLLIPDSCGPFLETLEDAKLISPLTGATETSKACILRLPKSDAFISWGWFKHEDLNEDALNLESGNQPKFLSVGFIDPDRGVCIDICDRGNDDANRCELSRLVGHTRKSFVVGNTNVAVPIKAQAHKPAIKHHRKQKNVIPVKKYKVYDFHSPEEPIHHHKEHKEHKEQKKRYHYQQQHEHKHEHAAKLCGIDHIKHKPIHNENHKHEHIEHHEQDVIEHHQHENRHKHLKHKAQHKHHKHKAQRKHHKCPHHHNHEHRHEHHKHQHRRHRHPHHKHEHGSNEIVAKIDMIENDIRTIIARSEAREHRRDKHACPLRHKERKDCPLPKVHRVEKRCPFDDDIIDHPRVKEHRVKTCSVQHPLLYPPRPAVLAPLPAPLPAPVYNDNTRLQESKLLNRFRRLNSRLYLLEREVVESESLVARRLTSLDNWVRRQKAEIMNRANDFIDYLARLKADVVYSPMKATEKKLISGIGKALRKGGDILKHPVNYVDDTLVDPVRRNVVNPVKREIFDPVTGHVRNVVVNPVMNDVVNPVAKAANNVVVDPIRDSMARPVKRELFDPVKREVFDPVKREVFNPVKREVFDPVKREVFDPVKRTVKSDAFDPVKRELFDPVKREVFDPVKNTAFDPVKRELFDPVKREMLDPVKLEVFDPVKREVFDPVKHTVKRNAFDPVKRELFDPIKRNAFDPIKRNAFDPIKRNAFDPIARPVTPVNRYDRFDFNDDLLPPVRADLAAAAVGPLGPVGPVLPDDPSLRAAFDYLN